MSQEPSLSNPRMTVLDYLSDPRVHEIRRLQAEIAEVRPFQLAVCLPSLQTLALGYNSYDWDTLMRHLKMKLLDLKNYSNIIAVSLRCKEKGMLYFAAKLIEGDVPKLHLESYVTMMSSGGVGIREVIYGDLQHILKFQKNIGLHLLEEGLGNFDEPLCDLNECMRDLIFRAWEGQAIYKTMCSGILAYFKGLHDNKHVIPPDEIFLMEETAAACYEAIRNLPSHARLDEPFVFVRVIYKMVIARMVKLSPETVGEILGKLAFMTTST